MYIALHIADMEKATKRMD